MITLNDYLYSGDTVLRILHKYHDDLLEEAQMTQNELDFVHCEFLAQITDLLEHNEFLTSQSQRIRELYKYMAKEYPFLAFTFKGRIKSLIRAEEKFNGYVVETIHDYYKQYGTYPSIWELKRKLSCFRDLIAYRIVVSLPRCQMKPGMTEEDKKALELKLLYEIANGLPGFLADRGFTVHVSEIRGQRPSLMLHEDLYPYYRDYIEHPSPYGYQSLHITLYDNVSRSYIEVQLRTKEMDDYAEIGPANHLGYEKRQACERMRRDEIPVGESIFFDEAYERQRKLQELDLSKVDVNMFGAVSNTLVNDGCGLYRGRLILPFEHLSRFQNDLID